MFIQQTGNTRIDRRRAADPGPEERAPEDRRRQALLQPRREPPQQPRARDVDHLRVRHELEQLLRAFFAQQDTRTPMRFALIAVGVNIALGLTLFHFVGVEYLPRGTLMGPFSLSA